MEDEIDVDSPDMWGEWDAACWKAFEALHNNMARIGEAARRCEPKERQEGKAA